MDKFAENAFKEAIIQQAKRELTAWNNFSEDGYMRAHMIVVPHIGQDRFSTLCGVAIKAGEGDTLAEYAHELMMIAFHIGYKAKEMEGE